MMLCYCRRKYVKKIEDFIISEKYKVVFTVSTGIIHATKLLKYYDEYRKIAVFSLKQANPWEETEYIFLKKKIISYF